MNDKLWTKDFTLLWSGKFVSALGSFATSVALGFFILNLTGSSTTMANILATDALVVALLLPVGGLLADFLSRNKLMFFADVLRGLFLLIFAFLAFKDIVPVWFVFIVVAIIGFGRAVMSPASDSLIPDIVKKNNIRKANGFLMLSNQFSGFAGNSLGGFLFQLIGAPLLFLFDGITYVISGISELFINDTRVNKKLNKNGNLIKIKEGFIFLLKDKAALSLATFAGLSNMIFALGMVVLIPYFDEFFTPALYGLLMAILAAGVLIGSLLIGHLKNINPRLFFTLSILFFPSLFSLAYIFNNFWIIAIFIFIGSVFNGIANNYIGSALQLLGPAYIRARVVASAKTFIMLLRPVGMFFAGLLMLIVPLKLLLIVAYGFPLLLSVFYLLKTSLLDTIDFENKI